MTAVLFVDVARYGRIVGARVEPMYIEDGRPLAAGARGPAVLARIRRLSSRFGTSVTEDGRLFDPDYVAPEPPPLIRIPILRLP